MNSIELHLNGKAATYGRGATVREMVSAQLGKEIGSDGRALDGSALGVAIAVNGAVIPRSSWAEHELSDGARVELVTAAQGG